MVEPGPSFTESTLSLSCCEPVLRMDGAELARVPENNEFPPPHDFPSLSIVDTAGYHLSAWLEKSGSLCKAGK